MSIEPLQPTVPESLDPFFRSTIRLEARELLLVAFSGGCDSTALLASLAERAPDLGIRLHAVHVDHRSDPGSGDRAAQALDLARSLDVSSTLVRVPDPSGRGPESAEATARRHRYALLAEVADQLGARYVATAHHADDQAETVLLRLLYGSGLEGLAGIAPVHGRFLRPLLQVGRQQITAYVEERGLGWVEDPTNADTTIPRNAVRHLLLPGLERQATDRLGRVATAARRARRRIERLLLERLEPRTSVPDEGLEIELDRLLELPRELRSHALAFLHRHAGLPYPPGRPAQNELWRQLQRGGAVGCDCGAGWRWQRSGSRLLLLPEQPTTPSFAYTVEMPGHVDVQELGLRFHLEFAEIDSWMFRRHPDRAGLAVAEMKGQIGVVRTRRPGDRFQALGRRHPGKLKDLLNRRRIPPRRRSRLPLLVIDGEIAWVPGVAIADRFRIRPDSTAILSVRIQQLKAGRASVSES